MSVEIVEIDGGQGIVMRIYDDVTGKDIIEAQYKMYQQHKIHVQNYHIIDKSWCSDFNVTAEDIEVISFIDKKFAHLNPNMIIAIVESSMLQFSLTEAWQAHIEGVIKYSKSFKSVNDASVWVKEQLFEIHPEGINKCITN